MGILAWIIVGGIAGWLASLVVRGGGYGIIGDIVVGIVGGLIGGFVASALFGIPDPVSGINILSIVVAFIGAVVLLLILRAVAPARTRA